MKRSTAFPILRVSGGALLVLAGILWYVGIGFGAASILVLVIGGGVVLVAAAMGHRARPLDYCIFLLGILVLGAVTAGYSLGPQLASYSATKDQVQAGALSLAVSASSGAISVGITDRANLAYQVNFTRQAWSPFFSVPGEDTVTNSTSDGVFHLDVGSTWSSISVLLGRGYSLDIDATTGTGSIDLQAVSGVDLRNVTLHSSTGSVSAVIDSSAVQNLRFQADTGSVSLVSHSLGAAGRSVPLVISTTTGSVSVSLNIASQDAVSVSAGTTLGSVSQNLRGFTITENSRTNLAATYGNMQTAASSFAISASATLGSVDLSIGFD